MGTGISITALVLAAGMSRRMGSVNKLLLKIDGETMLERSIRPILEAGLDRVVVVTGYESEKIESCLSGYKVEFVHNDQFEEGMGTSLARGVASMGNSKQDGIMVSLGDLPCLRKESVSSVVDVFNSKSGEEIIVPMFGGKPGHPIVFPFRYKNELKSLRGDEGAKKIIGREKRSVVRLELGDKGITLDIDGPDFFET